MRSPAKVTFVAPLTLTEFVSGGGTSCAQLKTRFDGQTMVGSAWEFTTMLLEQVSEFEFVPALMVHCSEKAPFVALSTCTEAEFVLPRNAVAAVSLVMTHK